MRIIFFQLTSLVDLFRLTKILTGGFHARLLNNFEEIFRYMM